jgi:hypothetical protein
MTSLKQKKNIKKCQNSLEFLKEPAWTKKCPINQITPHYLKLKNRE